MNNMISKLWIYHIEIISEVKIRYMYLIYHRTYTMNMIYRKDLWVNQGM